VGRLYDASAKTVAEQPDPAQMSLTGSSAREARRRDSALRHQILEPVEGCAIDVRTQWYPVFVTDCVTDSAGAEWDIRVQDRPRDGRLLTAWS